MDTYGSVNLIPNMKMQEIVQFASVTCFPISTILNATVIFAIIRFSSDRAGFYYKFTQVSLSFGNVVAGGIIMLARPMMHLHSGVFIFGGRPFFDAYTPHDLILSFLFTYMYLLTSLNGMSASLMVYRILMMSRRYSYYVQGKKTLFLPLISALITLPSIIFMSIEMWPNAELAQTCFTTDLFGRCNETIGAAVVRHLQPGSAYLVSTLHFNGVMNWRLGGAMLYFLIVVVTSQTIVCVGARWILKISSEGHNKCHRQLTKALLVQFLIPAVLVQGPLAVGLVGSLLGTFTMDNLFTFIPMGGSIYCVLDPLAVITNVGRYRSGVWRMVTCRHSKVDSASSTPEDEARSHAAHHHASQLSPPQTKS